MALAQEGINRKKKGKSLETDLQNLYDQTRAQIGQEDLAYIKHIAAYSKAIKARSEELIQNGGENDALKKGTVLRALHILLEFSELGHNIMHGCYDNIPRVGEFHSDKWTWDFVTDPLEWKTMHHQNHHPYTNIVGKDHDIGYSIARFLPNQDWFGHHGLQPGIFILFFIHVYHFTLYTATSAARVEGRSVLSLKTFKRSFDLIKRDIVENYIKQPFKAKSRFLHTLLGNYAGTTLGYDLTIIILILEHHAPNVQLFADPGPNESQEEYYRRQILATTNFTPMKELDDYFQNILESEVEFENKPPFDVFYGGLTTHLEHQLFPDLPCNRQREGAPQVEAICNRYDLPYNVIKLEDVVPSLAKGLMKWSVPVNGEEQKPSSLIYKPVEFLRRLYNGVQYKRPEPDTYFKGIRYYNVISKVSAVKRQISGNAISISILKPKGWDTVQWDAGAYISVRVKIGNQYFIRQYSLVNDSEISPTFDITVKRVKDGRVSNFLNSNIKKGSFITIVGLPQNDGAFIKKKKVKHPVMIAGGVGITPIISMIRKLIRENPNQTMTLLYFNRDTKSIIYEKELRKLSQTSNLNIHFICDNVSRRRRGVEQNRLSKKLLKAKIECIEKSDVYVCAPPAFIEACKVHLLELDMPKKRFHTESFSLPTLKRPKSSKKKYSIQFKKSNKTVEIDGSYTLLEAAREAGLNPPSGCERGLCKACVCTKSEGKIKGEKEDRVLSRVTICDSFPKSDVVLDL